MAVYYLVTASSTNAFLQVVFYLLLNVTAHLEFYYTPLLSVSDSLLVNDLQPCFMAAAFAASCRLHHDVLHKHASQQADI
jgi:hypothetical protein